MSVVLSTNDKRRSNSGSLSVAVCDVATMPHTRYGNNLYSYLLLSSELKGFVNNPSYYFEDLSSKRLRALDLLLLTQGWRRYEWKEQIMPEIRHPIENELLLDGKLEIRKASHKVVNQPITLRSHKGKMRAVEAWTFTDSVGYFMLRLGEFYGSHENWDITSFDPKLEIKKGGNKKIEKLQERHIRLNQYFSPSPRSFNQNDYFFDFPLHVPSKQVKVHKSISELQELDNIIIGKKRRRPETYVVYDVEKT